MSSLYFARSCAYGLSHAASSVDKERDLRARFKLYAFTTEAARRRPVHLRSAKPFSHADGFPRPEIASSCLRGNNKAARHSHMNCAPTGAGYRIHQSTWWSTINMQQPPHTLLPRFCPSFPFFLLSLSLFLALFLSLTYTHTELQVHTYTHAQPCPLFPVPSKRRGSFLRSARYFRYLTDF